MIYIITPFVSDFRSTCRSHELPDYYLCNSEIKWINGWEKLMGLRISDTDKVIKGEQYNAFSDEDRNRIDVELKIRSHKI